MTCITFYRGYVQGMLGSEFSGSKIRRRGKGGHLLLIKILDYVRIVCSNVNSLYHSDFFQL